MHWEIYDETHDEIGLVPTDGTRFGAAEVVVAQGNWERDHAIAPVCGEAMFHLGVKA
jgi:hypothetical protein